MRCLIYLFALGLICTSNQTLFAQFKEDDDATKKSKKLLKESQVNRLQIGATVSAKHGPCGSMRVQIPIPMDWPEQKVKKIDEQITKNVKSVKFKTLSKSVRVMEFKIPKLKKGEIAKVMITFEVTRYSQTAPDDYKDYRFGTKKDKALKLQSMHLNSSKFIETKNITLKKAAKEVMKKANGKKTDWEKVEVIYDWVRENVEYRNGPIKGALAALKDRTGDCEEMTSLFVAICRINGIPARSVWVPGHTYPEFFLLDKQDVGHWFPCQAAGSRAFGGIPERRAILQKGDNVRCPIRKRAMRYVSPTIRGTILKGAPEPHITFTRKTLAIE